MKYQFIEQYKQTFPVVAMCRVLSVSESGYYAWRKRPESQHTREDARLTTHIQQIFVEFRGVYGSPRIHAELQDQGSRCSRKRVARLMQENGMDARRKRFRPITTKRNPSHSVAPNLLRASILLPRVPMKSGLAISRMSQPLRDGCTWRSCSMCFPGA